MRGGIGCREMKIKERREILEARASKADISPIRTIFAANVDLNRR
jgi:hypothetical protein